MFYSSFSTNESWNFIYLLWSLKKDITTEELIALYRDFYKDDYFVKILDGLPETRWVKGSNLCHIGIKGR